ncbi:MAG TPA: PIN domain-containing protein [Burkholderiales bacterium]|nr:PIN domain-containing protein [Burkholderiales bacterium]
MGLTYILIDFENVKPTAADLKLIRGAGYRVLLFHGPHQNKFDADIVKVLQPLGIQVEFIQCERTGKNALDFHIAFYLGRHVEESKATASTSKEKTRFIVVSKDGGFDVLLDHIETLGYGVMRAESVHQALVPEKKKDAAAAKEPTAKTAAPTKSVQGKTENTFKVPSKNEGAMATTTPKKAAKAEPWKRLIENLRGHPNNQPATILALERHVTTLLGKNSTEKAVKALLARLQKEGIVVVKGKKIEYDLPNE